MIYIIISTLCLLLAVAMFVMYCYDRFQVISLRDEIDRVRDEKNIVIEFLHKTAEDISAAFDDVWNAQDKAEAKTGMEQLMDKYKEMLEQETERAGRRCICAAWGAATARRAMRS